MDDPVLEDNYPVYASYWYVADGKPVRSDWHGITAARFKAKIGAKVLCRCDLVGRARDAMRTREEASVDRAVSSMEQAFATMRKP